MNCVFLSSHVPAAASPVLAFAQPHEAIIPMPWLIGIGIFVGLVLLVGVYLLSRFAPKGAALAVGAAIYAGGWFLSPVPWREAQLLAGVFKTVGIVCIILGIVDLVRKRKRKAENPPPHQPENSA